jgi:hypothetical protein
VEWIILFLALDALILIALYWRNKQPPSSGPGNHTHIP